jgi:aryl-alcohol dehydrogenase-like predicted oxidoreductase
MQYRTFGRTGWQVSEITFGGWQLGGTWGAVDEKESIDTLLYAFEKGINLVDTAVLYGNGRSESTIGKALKQWQGDRIFVATKVPPFGIVAGQSSDLSIKGRYPEHHVRENVEASLQRLGVDCIDLLQLHLWIEDGVTQFEWLEGLLKLIDEGKIRHLGVSLPDICPSTGSLLAKSGLVAAQQVIFNIFEQEPADELFRYGETTSTAFIARVPFDSGALTGSWTEDTYAEWDKSDKRHHMYRGERYAETLARVKNIEAVCSKFYPSLAEAAMKYCLHDVAVSTVACGMRNRAEVDLNTAYSDGSAFPIELLEALRPYAWKHQFY